MNFNFFEQINFQKFLDKDYIFEPSPPPTGLYQYLAVIFGLFLIAGVIIAAQTRRKEEIYKKLFVRIVSLFLFTGTSGLILVFFRYEGIPYLGSRLLLLVLLAVFIIWALLVVRYKFLILPKEIRQYQKKKIFEKYLP